MRGGKFVRTVRHNPPDESKCKLAIVIFSVRLTEITSRVVFEFAGIELWSFWSYVRYDKKLDNLHKTGAKLYGSHPICG